MGLHAKLHFQKELQYRGQMCECIELAIRNNSPTVAHSPYCGRPKYGYVDTSQFYPVKQTEHPVKQSNAPQPNSPSVGDRRVAEKVKITVDV